VPDAPATILFVGDLVGGLGRRTLLGLLPALRERHDPTFVVVNGENVAGGLGITPKIADELLAAGVDVITLGNHAYHRKEIYPYLDGRVTACVGTHTHVPTADARLLPGGTAYITDVGMTGPRGGVIGVQKELAIERFLTQMPVKFETAADDPWLNAVVIEADDAGRATSIEQVLLPDS